MEAVLDISGPFETDEFNANAALRYYQSRYTRCQTQSMISHGSNCYIASQYKPSARRNVPTFPHGTKGLEVSGNHRKRPAQSAGLWSE